MVRKSVGIYLDEEIDRKLKYFSYIVLNVKKSQLIEFALKILFEVLEDRAECVLTDADLEQMLQAFKEKTMSKVEVI